MSINNMLHKYKFANPKLLKLNMSDISIRDDRKEKISVFICEIIDKIVRHELDIDSLLIYLKKKNNEFDNKTLYGLVQAIKKYINSSDFNFPGKIVVKTWFWGEIKYGYINHNHPTLKALNECLDKLMENYAPSQEKIDKKDYAAPYDSLYKILHKTFKIAGKPTRILTYACAFANVINAQALNSKCNLYGQNDPLVTFSHPLSTYDDYIQQYYYTIQNAPFKDVKYFVFLEDHDNQDHRELSIKIFPKVTKPGDHVLLEGFGNDINNVPCEMICLDPTPQGYNINNCMAKYSGLLCSGWEDQELNTAVGISYGMVPASKKDALQTFAVEIKTLFDDLTNIVEVCYSSHSIGETGLVIHTLSDFIDSLKKLNTLAIQASLTGVDVNLLEKKLDNYTLTQDQSYITAFYKAAENKLNEISDQLTITARNKKGIIQSLEKDNNTKYNTHIIAGAAHFIPTRTLESNSLPYEYRLFKKRDHVREIREYFTDNLPHMILLPRN